MKSNHEKHGRRSIRLPGYDYSQAGAYFVTICAHERRRLFGEIVNDEMQLNEFGLVVEQCWLEIPNHFSTADIDYYVVMPNHFHGILWICDRDDGRGTPWRAPTTNDAVAGTPWRAPTVEKFGKPTVGTLPTMIRSFKSAVTKGVNELRQTPAAPVWQRNYFEHVVRNEDALNRIREYIMYNSLHWAFDRDNPAGKPDDTEINFWNNLR